MNVRNPFRRLRARWRLRNDLRLYWHPDYAPRTLEGTRLAADRVPRALGQLAAEGLLRGGDLHRPRPATYEQLALVHTPDYLDATTQPGPLARIFGMDAADMDVDAVLNWQRAAVGGTVAACRAVTRGPFAARVAVNLGGGFHHAEPDRGSGFCVFNDVAVAIAHLRGNGFTGRTALVDLDFHEGDGNLAAFADDPLVAQYSIHGALRRVTDPVDPHEVVLAPGTGDTLYLATLRATLPVFLDEARPALVIYLAGQDVLLGDPLGGFALTPEAVLVRDRFVLDEAARRDLPVVVLLAGGYSTQAWSCTANLLRYVLAGTTDASREEAQALRARFQHIAAEMDAYELQRDDVADLTLDDMMADLGAAPPATRLLDHYSRHGVEYGLERYGVLGRLRALGYDDLRVDVDVATPWRQSVRVEGRKGDGPSVRLVELVGRRRHVMLPPPWPGREPLEMLALEWLLLQDPSASFCLARPRLPGQEHPGLGIAQEMGELLRRCALRVGLAGVLARPAYFHNALGAHDFHFADPVAEGTFLALRELLAGVSPDEASALLESGVVHTADGRPVSWIEADQVLPVSDGLVGYFSSAEYLAAVEAARAGVVGSGLQVAPAA